MAWLAGLSAGASLAGSLIGASSAKKAAREQMKWQQTMDNTKHQREVIDLKKAGLNPMLSAGAAGSAPSGAMDLSGQILAQAGSNAVNSAMSTRNTDSTVSKQDAETENIKTLNNQIQAQTDKTKAETAVAMAQLPLTSALTSKARSDALLSSTSATKMSADPKFMLGDALKALGLDGGSTAKSLKDAVQNSTFSNNPLIKIKKRTHTPSSTGLMF